MRASLAKCFWHRLKREPISDDYLPSMHKAVLSISCNVYKQQEMEIDTTLSEIQFNKEKQLAAIKSIIDNKDTFIVLQQTFPKLLLLLAPKVTSSLYPEFKANLKLPVDTFYRAGVNVTKRNITTGLCGLYWF